MKKLLAGFALALLIVSPVSAGGWPVDPDPPVSGWKIDLCPNINGKQVHMPRGYVRVLDVNVGWVCLPAS
jgi:hypothetical protein